MANFIIPVQLKICIQNIDEDELEQYVNDFQFGLSEAFYSSDPDDDHFSIEQCDIKWSEIKET